MWSWILKHLYPAHQKSRIQYTVRVAFPVAVVTTLFAGLAAVTTHTGSYITITTSESSIVTGEEITITVSAKAHVPVNAVDIVIDYPENQMRFKGIDTGESVITLWTEEPYEDDGKIYLRGGVFQRGFIGEHDIAKIRMEPTATGLAYVTLDSASFVAGDGKGTLVQVEKVTENSTRIYVNPADGALEGKAILQVVTDVDGNGVVDLSDISTFMAAWFTKSKTFDFNGDGRMTFKDFSILLSDSFFK